MKNKRRITSIGLAAVLVLAACSDDSSDTGSTTAESVTTEASATSESTVGTDAPTESSAPAETNAPASGEPIKIMTIMRLTAANQSTTEAAGKVVEAGVEALNANGGVLGRPVEVIVCDDGSDPNSAAECARQAVDEGVVAVVGSASANADAVNPVLEAAGIPNIGGFPAAASDFMSPISFPLGGSPSWIAGCAKMLVENGSKKIAVVYFDLPSGAFATTFAEQALVGTGAEVESTVPVPIEAVDYNPLVSSAADDADGILLVLQPEMAARWVVAANQQGIDVAQCAPGLSDEVIAPLGDQADGILVASYLAPVASGGPGIERFVSEVGDELSTDFYALGSWLGLQLFAKAVEAAQPSEVTSATVLAAMQAADGIDLEGISPDYSTQTPGPDPLIALYNTYYWPAVVDGNEIVSPTGEPADAYGA